MTDYTGCEESKITPNSAGVVRTYHDKEQTILKEEYFQLNGKKEGVYTSYYGNNNLKNEYNYIDGKKHGKYKIYYYHGQIYEDGECFMDKPIKYTRYHDNGYKCAEYYSNRDDSIYYNKIYNENGILEEEICAQDEKEFQNKILKYGNYI
jgi:antitoxin component YwqK of YwqJK toxin-antitoxin module